MEIHEHTASEIAGRIHDGSLSSEEVVRHFLDRIETLDGSLNAVVTVTADLALDQARRADEARASGRILSPLMGVPVLLKDNISLEGHPTTCGSRILEGYRPIDDAHVVERLKAAGMPILGKTNMDEFAMGSSTEHSAHGPVRNPWDRDRVPGGSSGGSAAAVAARLAPLALGSDTGGSIRQPASLCGVVGLKPTYGRVSRYGLVAFASSLDQIGTFGTTVADAGRLLDVIAGLDPRDSTSAPVQPVSQPSPGGPGLAGCRIGVVTELMGEGLSPGTRKALEAALVDLTAAGARLEEVSLPHLRYGIPTYYVVACAEASSNLARYDGVRYGLRVEGSDLLDQYRRVREEGFGAEVKRRIMLGTFVLSSGYHEAYYGRAMKVRTLIRRDFDRAFERFDALAGAISPSPAFRLGERRDDPVSMYMSDICTVTANLAGIPGISIPCGFEQIDGSGPLPVGLQILARPFDESRLLGVGFHYQERTDFHRKSPILVPTSP